MQGDEQQDAYARERFRDHDRRAEAMEAAAVESANQALKALLILNGGACVALLGFLAATFGKPDLADQNLALLSALRLFGWGAAMAVLLLPSPIYAIPAMRAASWPTTKAGSGHT